MHVESRGLTTWIAAATYLDMQPSEVGERIRMAREMVTVEGRKLSSRELSRLARVSPSVVNHIERGRSEMPGFETLVALADLLGASVDWLATGRGEAPTQEQAQAAIDHALTTNPRVEASTGTEG